MSIYIFGGPHAGAYFECMLSKKFGGQSSRVCPNTPPVCVPAHVPKSKAFYIAFGSDMTVAWKPVPKVIGYHAPDQKHLVRCYASAEICHTPSNFGSYMDGFTRLARANSRIG
jgi:hypothetical protein